MEPVVQQVHQQEGNDPGERRGGQRKEAQVVVGPEVGGENEGFGEGTHHL